MKKSELDALQSLLTQAMNRDIARLAKIREQITATEAAKAELGVQAQSEFPQASSMAELQCYNKWTGWADQKSSQFDRACEVLGEQADAARVTLTRSFGKTEAVKVLGGVAEKEELRDHRRKAEQNGQIPDR